MSTILNEVCGHRYISKLEFLSSYHSNLLQYAICVCSENWPMHKYKVGLVSMYLIVQSVLSI